MGKVGHSHWYRLLYVVHWTRTVTVGREGGAQTQRWCDGNRSEWAGSRKVCMCVCNIVFFISIIIKIAIFEDKNQHSRRRKQASRRHMQLWRSVFRLIFLFFIFSLTLSVDHRLSSCFSLYHSGIVADSSMKGKGPYYVSYPYNQASLCIWPLLLTKNMFL